MIAPSTKTKLRWWLFQARLGRFLVATIGGVLGASAQAAISVTATGTWAIEFATTPAVADFATGVLNGTGDTFNNSGQIDAAVAAVDASNVVRMLPTSTTQPPSPYSGGFRHNTAGLFIQSRPATDSTNAANILKGVFQNNTGRSLTAFVLSYDFNTFNPFSLEVPGFQVYFSPDGTPNSWLKIPGLSGSEAAGNQSVVVVPTLPIGDAALFYILWVDDNADGLDPSYVIDNLRITPIRISIAPSITAGMAVISWIPATGTLMSSTSVTTPRSKWETVPGSSPVTVSTTNMQKFYIISVP